MEKRPTATSDQELPPFAGEIKFTWRGRECLLRLTSKSQLARSEGPTAASLLLYHQMSDLAEMNFMAMTALAEDLYSRVPEGSREFEKFIEGMGPKFRADPGNKITIANNTERG